MNIYARKYVKKRENKTSNPRTQFHAVELYF